MLLTFAIVLFAVYISLITIVTGLWTYTVIQDLKEFKDLKELRK